MMGISGLPVFIFIAWGESKQVAADRESLQRISLDALQVVIFDDRLRATS